MAFDADYYGGWATGSQQRSKLGRILWGAAALVTGLVGMGLAAGGTFAPPEMERIQFGTSNAYYVNVFRYMYLAASVLLPVSAFAVWKASHRGGLGFWRSTVRPGAMCGGGAMVGLGLSFASFIAMGAMQGLGIIAAGVGAAVMLFFWILRGPSFTLQAGDAYWSRALTMVFAIGGLTASVGSVRNFQQWSKDRYSIERPGEPFVIQKAIRDRWDSESEEFRTEQRSYRVPRLAYHPQPISAALLGLLAFGCLSEMRFRMKLSRRAKQMSFDRLF